MTRILVIEDEPFLREEILEILGFENFEAIGAENGQKGVQLAHELHPDLIICDIMMPKLDGFGVLKEIREAPELAPTPFIFLTAKVDKMDVRQGMQQGADDYLTKPFTKAELLEAIAARLERQALMTRAQEQKLEDAKKVFSRMVAHELRTPLISITMVQEIISRNLENLSRAEIQELMNSMESGSRRLSHLVEQMVLLTQLETEVLNPDTLRTNGRPMPVQELIKSAIELGKKFATRDQNVQLHCSNNGGQAAILCDSRALKHALAEVIANALNFSPPEGDVFLKSWQADDGIWISCLDRGAGISKKDLSRVFDNFYQVDRDTQEQQGVGVGLWLARRIVEIHGGDITISSGAGTEVLIRLPKVSH